jgi:phosphoenolpyruvate-protein kinase (PTS system EI component)
MIASTYAGRGVSDGIAAGVVYLADPPGGATGTITIGGLRAAFASVAAERSALAGELRASGRDRDAGIVEIGALIAADPALVEPAIAAIEGTGTEDWVPLATAAGAVTEAAEAQARILEALPDPDLALRAADVRQVATAVVARLSGATAPPPPDRPFILVRREVDPADLIRLADSGLAGAVSVNGGASSHAAIIARGLGLPMLAGADPAVLTAAAGHPAILDATAGELTVDPPLPTTGRGTASVTPVGGLPAAPRVVTTADGEPVTLLCNVASGAETRLGLSGGAAGVGLLRTEIPFTQARGWPTRDEHLAALSPILGLLAGRTAVVRLLDFAGDKVPPFPGAEGLAAFLSAPRALAGQLAAVLEAGRDADLRVMIPMVRTVREIHTVRDELARAAKAAGLPPPPLGIMVEVEGTAAGAHRFAAEVDFFSVGTNDLTADVLCRGRSELRPADTADPAVLRLIRHVTVAARQAGIGVSVCGDSAADPAVLPLLIGLGVRALSVGAARVPLVASWVAQLSAAEAAAEAAARIGAS